METYEKLGAFYLGREWDPESEESRPGWLLYDSRDLTTHAAIIGMTGSGKTGLGVGLMEEAALDGIPVIAVDPKGDLGNLLLTFPELLPEDFLPWVTEEEAARNGTDRQGLAAKKAELWRTGLEKWDQSPERIRRLRESAEFAIYTPGSEAGIPLSILGSLSAPPAEVRQDGDLYRSRISTTAGSLLQLVGIDADPVTSREHILLSTILEGSWDDGVDLDLADLIRQIQEPSFSRVGVMELEGFFPGKDRFQLAMAMNNLAASPSFAAWRSGEPLSADRLLFTDTGKPRVSVISIAHLSERERQFFVSLLLSELLTWMRSRPGTSGLRALFYMDEVFGYLPPVKEPPTKKLLLTLLKQARAYGLGLVLSTQNPVDLDYKALSNCGTWFLGRLQTEGDRDRVLDGLVTASGGDRQKLARLLSGLDKRVFLLHSVHDDEPVLFRTRWVLSYLKGPMTRPEISRLMDDVGREASAQAAKPAVPPQSPPSTPPRERRMSVAEPPLLPPGIEVIYLPRESGVREPLSYAPSLLGSATVRFVDRKGRFDHSREVVLAGDFPRSVGGGAWDEAEPLDLTLDDLLRDPEPAQAFEELPKAAGEARSYAGWKKSLSDTLYRTQRLPLLESPRFGLLASPEESEREFRIRLREKARELRDEVGDQLKEKFGKKRKSLETKIHRAQQKVERESEQYEEKKRDSFLHLGASVLSAVLGGSRRLGSSRTATSISRMGRLSGEKADVRRAREDLERLAEEMRELDLAFEDELAEVRDSFDPELEELRVLEVAPRRTDIRVDLVALAWRPH